MQQGTNWEDAGCSASSALMTPTKCYEALQLCPNHYICLASVSLSIKLPACVHGPTILPCLLLITSHTVNILTRLLVQFQVPHLAAFVLSVCQLYARAGPVTACLDACFQDSDCLTYTAEGAARYHLDIKYLCT